ncbi:MAG TPA: PaaI family thioesterase [Nocardioidaceae bacterium]|nr:PaaI family thioesterase [Nocardioidaceae bacterium]
MDASALDQLKMHELLDLEVTHAAGDRVVLEWTVAEQHLQPFGLAHGGVHCLVNESTASIGAGLWFAEQVHGEAGGVVGVNNNTDFLRAARPGDHLTATATPIHQGRLQQLWLIESRDAEGRLVARGQVRLQNLPPRS